MDALERIADALERIAICMELRNASKNKQTPFPWHEIPLHVWKRIKKDVMDPPSYSVLKNFTWPLSCEDLVNLGPGILSECRMVGKKRLDVIGAKLDELGFKFGEYK